MSEAQASSSPPHFWRAVRPLAGPARPALRPVAFAAIAITSVLTAGGASAGSPLSRVANDRAASFLASADPEASADPDAGAAGEVCVRGRLTDEGVECPALRGADGRLYTLAGRLGGLALGAEACICGTVAELSTCMQGTTLAITRIAPAADCP